MSGKTRTVFHPVMPGVFRTVSDSDAAKWKDAGWRLTEPKRVPEPEPDVAPAEPAVAAESDTTN